MRALDDVLWTCGLLLGHERGDVCSGRRATGAGATLSWHHLTCFDKMRLYDRYRCHVTSVEVQEGKV